MGHPSGFNSSKFSAADWAALKQAYQQAQSTGLEATVMIADGSGRRASYDPDPSTIIWGSVEIEPGHSAWASATTAQILAR